MMLRLSFVFFLQGILLMTEFFADCRKEPSLNILHFEPAVYNDGDIGAVVCVAKEVKDPVEWISPSNDTVGDSSGNSTNRLYVERPHPKNNDMMAILVIHSTKLTDSGIWTCKSGDLTDTVKIYIREKVEFEEIQADKGKNAKLTCEAKGYPEPTVTWYKGNSKVGITENSKYILGKNNNTYTLEIRRLTHQDFGEYICKVTQEAPYQYTRKIIELAVHPFSTEEPSLNIIRLKPSVYKVGDYGAIVCVVDNAKNPVEWISPSGDMVGGSSKKRRLYVERVPKHEDMLVILVFESTKLTDSGNWTCKSGDLSDTVKIIVGR